MKNKSIIIITAVLLLLALASCDSLVAPIKERLNPVDSYNPVPAAEGFDAAIAIDSDGTRLVNLSWAEGTTSGEVNLDGYVIVSSVDSIPDSVWDGEFVALVYRDNDKSYIHRVGEEPAKYFGYTIYYSIFSFGPKYDDMSEDERIGFNDNNTLVNTQNYNFTGPVSDSQDVWDVKDIPVSVDKYMDAGSVWHDGQDITIITNTSNPATIAGITFNIAGDAPDGDVQLAQLILTKFGDNSNGDGIVELAVWEEDWQTADGWAAGNMLPDMIVNNQQDINIPSGGGDVIEVDVTNTYEDWVSGAVNNYGFSLRSYDGSNSFPFCASEEGPNGPKLRVYYMH